MIAVIAEHLNLTPTMRAQDVAAFEALVARTERPLLVFLSRLLGDSQEALDVLQETYVKALHQPGFLDDDFRQEPWLYRVSGNLARSTLRKIRRWLRPGPPPPEPAPPLELLLETEEQRMVQAALGRLPFASREVLLLRYFRELSYDDMSRVLDVPIGTVMSRLHRAKAQLERGLR